jgi:ATP-dependent protease ClpP protease subunit
MDDIDEAALSLVSRFFMAIKEDKPVTIYLSSTGGSTWYGMGIYDRIKAHKGHVTIIGIGRVESMATIIMQAADLRQSYPNTAFMHHQGNEGYDSDLKTNVLNLVKFTQEHDTRLDNIMLGRVKEKHPDMTLRKWQKIDMWDTYYFPEQLIEMGLLDEIIGIN